MIAEQERDEIEVVQRGPRHFVERRDQILDIGHGRRGHARGELVRGLVVLGIHLAVRRHRARQQFGAVAGAGGHIEHLPARLRRHEAQQLDRIALGVGLAVGLAAVGGGDQRRIVLRTRGADRAERQQDSDAGESPAAGRGEG